MYSSRKRFLTNFFILNISVISATKLVFRKNLKQMKGKKGGGKMKARRQVGKERQKEGAGEGE